MTQLSTEVFSHRLKIKGDGTRYITRKLAETIFLQLMDESNKTVTITNSNTLTYISKYKSEVELTELQGEDKSFEDSLHHAGLKEHQKEYIRSIWEQRKKDRKTTSDTVLQAMIKTYKEEGYITTN